MCWGDEVGNLGYYADIAVRTAKDVSQNIVNGAAPVIKNSPLRRAAVKKNSKPGKKELTSAENNTYNQNSKADNNSATKETNVRDNGRIHGNDKAATGARPSDGRANAEAGGRPSRLEEWGALSGKRRGEIIEAAKTAVAVNKNYAEVRILLARLVGVDPKKMTPADKNRAAEMLAERFYADARISEVISDTTWRVLDNGREELYKVIFQGMPCQ